MTLLLVTVLTAAPYAILTPGPHHGGSVSSPGQGWLGVFPTKLSTVTLALKKVHDPIDDDGKPDTVKTGIDVSAEGNPSVLLKGLAPRELAPIVSTPTSIVLDQPLALGDATLTAFAVGKGHQLVLTQGETKQPLYQHAEGDTDGWLLLWAGDLDGDGRLDLILAADHHYNLSTTRLYLSSRAKKGQLVAEVAKFSTSGC